MIKRKLKCMKFKKSRNNKNFRTRENRRRKKLQDIEEELDFQPNSLSILLKMRRVLRLR